MIVLLEIIVIYIVATIMIEALPLVIFEIVELISKVAKEVFEKPKHICE